MTEQYPSRRDREDALMVQIEADLESGENKELIASYDGMKSAESALIAELRTVKSGNSPSMEESLHYFEKLADAVVEHYVDTVLLHEDDESQINAGAALLGRCAVDMEQLTLRPMCKDTQYAPVYEELYLTIQERFSETDKQEERMSFLQDIAMETVDSSINIHMDDAEVSKHDIRRHKIRVARERIMRYSGVFVAGALGTVATNIFMHRRKQ